MVEAIKKFNIHLHTYIKYQQQDWEQLKGLYTIGLHIDIALELYIPLVLLLLLLCAFAHNKTKGSINNTHMHLHPRRLYDGI